jgi:hypothetical protein
MVADGTSDGSNSVVFCGVDTESFARKVELVQLCVDNRAVLIQRSSGLFGSEALTHFLGGSFFPAECQPVIFAGAELVGDAIALLEDGLVMHGCLDVTPLYSPLYAGGPDAGRCNLVAPSVQPLPAAPSDEAAPVVGLRRMYEQTYGHSWPKSKAVTMSDWSLRKLAPEQLLYAAQVRVRVRAAGNM